MKHEEVWRTCDRCGKKLNVDISILPFVKKSYTKRGILKLNTETYEPISHHADCKICAEINEQEKVEEMKIVTEFSRKTKELDLCGNCRKDFERFMQNESYNQ